MVDSVAAAPLPPVGQELSDELHEALARQPVAGAQTHDLGVLDEGDEDAPERVVAAHLGPESLGVLGQDLLAARRRGAGGGLRGGLGGQATGQEGLGDALAVKGRDHAACVTEQHEAVGVVGLAVEGHGQGGADQAADLILLSEAPGGRDVVHPAVEHGAIVDGGGRGARGDRAETDVDQPFPHRPDPPVAGQEIGLAGLAVPQLEARLHPGVLGARGAEVGAHGHAHGAALVLGAPDGGGQAGRDASGVDDQRGGEGGGPLDAGVGDPVGGAGLNTGDAAGGRGDGGGDGDTGEQAGSGCGGVLGQVAVEQGAGTGHPVGGEGGLLRPGEVEEVPATDDA